MNPFDQVRAAVVRAIDACRRAGELPEGLDVERITVEPPRDPSHGDAATNAALLLAKPAGRAPMDLAELLAARLRASPEVAAVEVARVLLARNPRADPLAAFSFAAHFTLKR